jgi:hypothetical protein
MNSGSKSEYDLLYFYILWAVPKVHLCVCSQKYERKKMLTPDWQKKCRKIYRERDSAVSRQIKT